MSILILTCNYSYDGRGGLRCDGKRLVEVRAGDVVPALRHEDHEPMDVGIRVTPTTGLSSATVWPLSLSEAWTFKPEGHVDAMAHVTATIEKGVRDEEHEKFRDLLHFKSVRAATERPRKHPKHGRHWSAPDLSGKHGKRKRG